MEVAILIGVIGSLIVVFGYNVRKTGNKHHAIRKAYLHELQTQTDIRCAKQGFDITDVKHRDSIGRLRSGVFYLTDKQFILFDIETEEEYKYLLSDFLWGYQYVIPSNTKLGDVKRGGISLHLKHNQHHVALDIQMV